MLRKHLGRACLLALVSQLALAEEFDLETWLADEAPAEESRPGEPQPASPVTLPAPTPAPAVRQAPAAARLEEIIVTAERRSASLQDTPISIAALTAQDLEMAGIAGLDDIGAHVPSLQIEPFPSNNATLRLYIRGIGLIDVQITQDPAVGIYLDGVYVARSTGTALEIADLERIEVLRGPQGTLYGRNTTGGAVNLITRRPSVEALSFEQTLSLGSRELGKARSTMNLPLSDTLAVKLAILGQQQHGFVENTGEGGDFGDKKQLGARLDLRWDSPLWPLLDYSLDFSDATQFNYMYQSVLTPESDKGPTEQIKREAQAESVYNESRLDSLASGAPMEPSTTRILGHALTLGGDLLASNWKYIAAYRELEDATYVDLGGGAGSRRYRLDTHVYDGPAALVAYGGPTPLAINTVTQSQWSHEFQLSGQLSSSLDFISGLFWMRETGIDDWTPMHHQFSAALNPSATAEMFGPVFSATAPRLVNFSDTYYRIENEAMAAFGQISWIPPILQQRLKLTLGYRHSRDRRFAVKSRRSENYVEYMQEGQGVAVPITSPSNPPDSPLTDAAFGSISVLNYEIFEAVPGRRSDSDDSVSLIAAYTLNDHSNVYGKYVEAYKSGGFNVRDQQIDGESRPAVDGNVYGYGYRQGFAPEYVRSLEFGLKSEWMNRRLRFNGNVFYTDYTDMQINFLLAGTVFDTKVANAGRARMWGLEWDATAMATRDLRFNVSYAFLDAKIKEVIDVNGDNVAQRFQFPSAPEHSYTLATDWTFSRQRWGKLHLHAAYQYMDERLGGANAGKPVQLRDYGVFNLRLMAEDLAFGQAGQLNLAIWAKNLADEEYEINAIENLPHADRAVLWGEPRSLGLDLTYRW